MCALYSVTEFGHRTKRGEVLQTEEVKSVCLGNAGDWDSPHFRFALSSNPTNLSVCLAAKIFILKPGLNASGACHRLALIEGQKENEIGES